MDTSTVSTEDRGVSYSLERAIALLVDAACSARVARQLAPPERRGAIEAAVTHMHEAETALDEARSSR